MITSLKLAATYIRRGSFADSPVEEQLAACREAAARDGYEIPLEALFIDLGVSRRARLRPGWEELATAVAAGAGAFERVYVAEPTRLGRWAAPRGKAPHRALFEAAGIEVRFAAGEPARACDGGPP